ncbi:hypothetical protein H4P35_06670 [Achromobacter sp. 77]|uniref:hypothetical protein n=1 Tax=Achromobacter sp. 77 TaxID=2756133 RepID=UPI001D021588|nr:hypothetical protein [Achromobacter sp. 77]UDG77025.1 hypothetical protein H4P35_06670 [Achromobacter sp. 77]
MTNTAPTMQEPTFDSYSLNGDDFQEGCVSEALQALDDNDQLTLGAEYRLGVSERPDPADFFDVDDLIEQMQERAHDVGGEFAEDYLTDLTDEQVLDLGRVVKAWLSSVNPQVNFFSVKQIQTFNVTQEDIDEHRSQSEAGAA